MTLQLIFQCSAILFQILALIFLCKSISNMKKSEKILKEQLRRYSDE